MIDDNDQDGGKSETERPGILPLGFCEGRIDLPRGRRLFGTISTIEEIAHRFLELGRRHPEGQEHDEEDAEWRCRHESERPSGTRALCHPSMRSTTFGSRPQTGTSVANSIGCGSSGVTSERCRSLLRPGYSCSMRRARAARNHAVRKRSARSNRLCGEETGRDGLRVGSARETAQGFLVQPSACSTACTDAVPSLAMRPLSRRALSNHGW